MIILFNIFNSRSNLVRSSGSKLKLACARARFRTKDRSKNSEISFEIRPTTNCVFCGSYYNVVAGKSPAAATTYIIKWPMSLAVGDTATGRYRVATGPAPHGAYYSGTSVVQSIRFLCQNSYFVLLNLRFDSSQYVLQSERDLSRVI